MADFEVGEEIKGILVETFRESSGTTRPRVRPVESLPSRWRVEFPRKLREESPIGTQFRCDVRVCQKHLADGSPKGPPYLRADTDSIVTLLDYSSDLALYAIPRPGSVSGRSYHYVMSRKTKKESLKSSFDQLRAQALSLASAEVPKVDADGWRFQRSQLMRQYALARSQGTCESCEEPAPFISRNGKPYLEVHHIVPVSRGGMDAPSNLAAVCPNCHARVTHGADAEDYNASIREKVMKLEDAFGC